MMYIPSNINSNCGIYRIKNMRNGKCYIGSSKNLSGRKSEHFRLLRSGNHNARLQNAYNKEENKSVFEFQSFIYCKENDLIAMEQSCFDKMKPEYNISLIAGKIEHTEEVKAKMRKRRRAFLDSDAGKEWLQSTAEKNGKHRKEFAQTPEGIEAYSKISQNHREYAKTIEGQIDYLKRSEKTSETNLIKARTPKGKAAMKALGDHNRELCSTPEGKMMAKERSAKGAAKRKANGSQKGLNHWTVQHKAAHYQGA